MDISELKRTDGSKAVSRHPWELTRAKIILFLLKKHSRGFQTILDTGSGDVFVLRRLEKENFARRYLAVDNAYTGEIINGIRSAYKDTVIKFFKDPADIEGHDLPADCFLFLDVIEHCPDDKTVLQAAANLAMATSNATILVTVPAFPGLFSQHDHLLQHYRRYSEKQLTGVCREAGLTVIASGYFFFSLLPLRMFHLFLERSGLKKSEKSIDNWTGGKILTRVLSALLWFDFKFGYNLNRLSIKLPGLSCYCLCHNSPS